MNKIFGFIGIFLFFTLGAVAHADDGKELQLDGRIALHAYRAIVEDELGDALNGLRSLAQTDDVQSANWDRAKASLTQFAKELPGHTVFLAQPDGTYFTVERGLIPQKLNDRDYFSGLFAGHDVIGVPVVARSTGNKAAVLAVPVMKDGKVVAALGASIDLELLSKHIDEILQLPKDVVAYAIDLNGQTVMHRDPALIFAYAAKMGSESLAAAMAEMVAKPEGAARYNFRDTNRAVIFERSRKLPWVFAIGSIQP